MDDPYIQSGGLRIHYFLMPAIESTMYIATGSENALVIDPHRSEAAFEKLRAHGIQTIDILLTHEHFDHISGVNWLREYFDCQVIASKETVERMQDPDKNLAKYWEVTIMDMPPDKHAEGMKFKDEAYTCQADRVIEDGDVWEWNGHTLHARAAPGHSPGSAIYFLDDLVFSGDSLVNGAGVLCRIPGGSWKTYKEKTLPLLQSLSDDTVICPGHGIPDTMAHLRKYLVRFGEVERVIGR